MIVENTIRQASKILKSNNINTYMLDAEIILSNIMGVSREFLIINSHKNISEKVFPEYDASKGTMELLAEILGQALMTLIGLFFI